MKKLTAALLLALALTGAHATAGPKKSVPLVIEGDTVTLVKGFPCTVKAAPGADVYLWSFPESVKATGSDDVLTITAAPDGEHKITVVSVTVDFDKKKVTKDSGSVTVLVGNPKPPPPPTPTDPLTKALQKAYDTDADADRAASLAFLQEAYKGMAAQAGTRPDKTNAEFVAWMKTVVEHPTAGLKLAQLKGLRTAIGTELSSAWGANEAPLSPSDAAKELDKIARALEGVR